MVFSNDSFVCVFFVFGIFFFLLQSTKLIKYWFFVTFLLQIAWKLCVCVWVTDWKGKHKLRISIKKYPKPKPKTKSMQRHVYIDKNERMAKKSNSKVQIDEILLKNFCRLHGQKKSAIFYECIKHLWHIFNDWCSRCIARGFCCNWKGWM